MTARNGSAKSSARVAATAISDRPDDDHTGRRLQAFLASMRPLDGNYDRNDGYYRGRSLIEHLALSAVGTENPTLPLTAIDCADILHFVCGSEPLEPKNWWKDPKHGPSHVCGFIFVLRAVEGHLRAGAPNRRNRTVRS